MENEDSDPIQFSIDMEFTPPDLEDMYFKKRIIAMVIIFTSGLFVAMLVSLITLLGG